MKRRISLGKAAAGIALFAVLFCMTVLPVMIEGRAYARVENGRSYYLLARACEEETAVSVSGQVYIAGGAGYLMKKNGKPYAVLACYYKETDCDLVARTMEKKGVSVEKVKLSGEDFELNGKASAYASKIEDNLETVDTVARVLYDLSNALERSEVDQETARSTLRGAAAAIAGLREGNGEGLFERWNASLNSAERKGKELASAIVFCKDVRYMQVQLTALVVNAKDFFA